MGLLEDRYIDLSKPQPYTKSVLYGPKGAGKTTLAWQWPNPCSLDYEQSTDTIRALIQAGVMKEGAAFAPRNLEESKLMVEEIVKRKQWDTLIVDTATRLQKLELRAHVKKQVAAIAHRTDENDVWMGDFKYTGNTLDVFFEYLMTIPMHVVIVTHNKEIYKTIVNQDKSTSQQLIKVEPDLPPKLAKSLGELFSLVGYMTSTPGATRTRKLQVNPSAIIEAKNRLFIQEQEINDPTYRKIFEHGN